MVVDGAQSTPHIPVDVQTLDADFFAFSGHKISGHKIYGPMGIGVLYGREEILDNMQPFLTGGEMIESVTRESATYAELLHKFEAGTVNAAGAVGLHAAIDYVNRVGFAEMRSRELALTRRAMEGIQKNSLRPCAGFGKTGGALRHHHLHGGWRSSPRYQRNSRQRRRCPPCGSSLRPAAARLYETPLHCAGKSGVLQHGGRC